MSRTYHTLHNHSQYWLQLFQLFTLLICVGNSVQCFAVVSNVENALQLVIRAIRVKTTCHFSCRVFVASSFNALKEGRYVTDEYSK